MRLLPEGLQKIIAKPTLTRRRTERGVEITDTETGESFELIIPAEEFTCPCCGQSRFPINECADPLNLRQFNY